MAKDGDWVPISVDSFLDVEVGVDGKTVKDELEAALQKAVADVMDRKHNKKARTVQVAFCVEPDIDQDSGRNFPRFWTSTKTNLPARKMPELSATETVKGEVMVEGNAPVQEDMIKTIPRAVDGEA